MFDSCFPPIDAHRTAGRQNVSSTRLCVKVIVVDVHNPHDAAPNVWANESFVLPHMAQITMFR